MPPEPNGWTALLERALKQLEKQDERMRAMDRRLTVVETRAATWAALAALVVSGVVSLLVRYLTQSGG